MKWIPAWLATAYVRLYVEKQTDMFGFEEAKLILGIKAKGALSIRLTRLEEAGFLISRRDPVDRRKKHFWLVEPNDAIFSYGLRSLSASDGVLDRLASASKKMDIVMGGSYAAHAHCGYASPGKMDVYAAKDGRDRLIALLSGRDTSISVDDSLSDRTARTNVHIHLTLTQEMLAESVMLDGIRYVRPEILVVEGLVEQTEFSLTDALSILITKKGEMDFGRLAYLAKSENVDRELGICMDLINLESKERVFSPGTIGRIHSGADLSRKRFFPRDKTVESEEYRRLSAKWATGICVARSLLSKIVTDLVR